MEIGSDAATSTFTMWMRDWSIKLNCLQQSPLDDRSLFFLIPVQCIAQSRGSHDLLFYPSPFPEVGQMFPEEMTVRQTTDGTASFALS